MTSPKFVFTFSTGRCGTGTVAKLFKQLDPEGTNQTIHEFLDADMVGEMTPGTDTLAAYNNKGFQNSFVQTFWENKFANLENLGFFNEGSRYVETSHLLCKAGLVEALFSRLSSLHWISIKPEITIIFLHRNPLDTIASMYTRGDFFARENALTYYLSPNYQRTLLNYDSPYLPFCEQEKDLRLNYIAWYYWEMRVRQVLFMNYFAKVLHPQFRIYEVNLVDPVSFHNDIEEIAGEVLGKEVILDTEHHNKTHFQFQTGLEKNKEEIANNFPKLLTPFDGAGEEDLNNFIDAYEEVFEDVFLNSQGINLPPNNPPSDTRH